MRLSYLTICGFLLAGQLLAGPPKSPTQMGMKTFRFQAHKSFSFDRLVFEFTRPDATVRPPSVKTQSNGRSVKIVVENTTVMSPISENAVNESFHSRGKFLGTISFNQDERNFTVGANLRDANYIADAFWLDNPGRLVIDVFPSHSPRASGPAILEQASTKSFRTQRVPASKEEKPREEKVLRFDRKDRFVCFARDAKTDGTVSYEEKYGKKFAKIEIIDPKEFEKTDNVSNVVCFPKNSRIRGPVAFKPAPVIATPAPVAAAPVPVKPVGSLPTTVAPTAAKPAVSAPTATAVTAAPVMPGPKGPAATTAAVAQPAKQVAPTTPVIASPAPVTTTAAPITSTLNPTTVAKPAAPAPAPAAVPARTPTAAPVATQSAAVITPKPAAIPSTPQAAKLVPTK